jgi:hypothetical protein
MFTNYFTGRHKPLEDQAEDLVDVLFFGLLSERERAVRRDEAPAQTVLLSNNGDSRTNGK